MSRYNAPFEIHVHGQLKLRDDVALAQLQEALKPLWKYAGARSFAEGSASLYDDEIGLQFDAEEHVLLMCWTISGNEDFRQSLDDLCMNLNELLEIGAPIEVTFFDAEFDEEEEEQDRDEASRDDFLMLFVGPTPAAIMQVQRDLLVHDTIHMMERHFDATELTGVINEIDSLFQRRFNNLLVSLDLNRPIKNAVSNNNHTSNNGGRRPRHLH